MSVSQDINLSNIIRQNCKIIANYKHEQNLPCILYFKVLSWIWITVTKLQSSWLVQAGNTAGW